jgi:hypothetical protein
VIKDTKGGLMSDDPNDEVKETVRELEVLFVKAEELLNRSLVTAADGLEQAFLFFIRLGK